jgi:hypothetical protein
MDSGSFPTAVLRGTEPLFMLLVQTCDEIADELCRNDGDVVDAKQNQELSFYVADERLPPLCNK